MNHRVKLPVLSKETLSEIAYGMENQESESVLCLDDGNVYPQEMLEEYFDDVEGHNFVDLPDWNSADGYRLMCSFVQVCDDDKLKNEQVPAGCSAVSGPFSNPMRVRFQSGTSSRTARWSSTSFHGTAGCSTTGISV